MIGHVSVEQYIFDDSKSVVDGMFYGLPLDEDTNPKKPMSDFSLGPG